MNTLQLTPISGTAATAAGASPTGEAVPSPNSKTTQQAASTDASQGAPATQVTNAVRAQAQQAAAAAEDQRAAARIETPSLNLNVGLVNGTFDVFVDLTETTDNRVIARVYGPRGSAAEPQPVPAKVRTEA